MLSLNLHVRVGIFTLKIFDGDGEAPVFGRYDISVLYFSKAGIRHLAIKNNPLRENYLVQPRAED